MSLSPGTRLLCRMNVLSGGAGCGKPPGAASRPNSLTRLGAGRALGRLLVEGEPQSQDPVAQRRAARTPPPPPVPHTPGPSQVASDKQGSMRPARPLEFSAQTENQRPLGD